MGILQEKGILFIGLDKFNGRRGVHARQAGLVVSDIGFQLRFVAIQRA